VCCGSDRTIVRRECRAAREDERNSVVASRKVRKVHPRSRSPPWNVSKWHAKPKAREVSPSVSVPFVRSFVLSPFWPTPSSHSPIVFFSLVSSAVARATARDFPRKSRENYVTSDGFGRNWDKVQCTLALRFTTRCFYAVIFPGLGNTRTVAPCSLSDILLGVAYSRASSLSPSLFLSLSFARSISQKSARLTAPDREIYGYRSRRRES